MQTEGARATDTFAVELAKIPPGRMEHLQELIDSASWRDIPSRHYDTADVKFWEPCDRAFFIRIPPGGFIPRHHDVFIPGLTHHLVVHSNKHSLNWWIDTQGNERSIHMKQGYRYEVAREPLHWAENNGKTDRIHLLVEWWNGPS